jgi:hypothetical protein
MADQSKTHHYGFQPTGHFMLPALRLGPAMPHAPKFIPPARSTFPYHKIRPTGDPSASTAAWEIVRRYPGLQVACLASLASILIEPLREAGADIEPFVLDIGGPSGTGKTVALSAMESMWGTPGCLRESWRTKDAALLRHAAVLRNLPLLVNEGQARTDKGSAATFLDFVYAFQEGRFTHDATGGVREWHSIAASTNEELLLNLTRTRTGAKARLLPLPRSPFGGVSAEAGRDVAALKVQIAAGSGHIGQRFAVAAVRIVRSKDGGLNRLVGQFAKWHTVFAGGTAETDATVRRVARYAALIALAAEMVNADATIAAPVDTLALIEELRSCVAVTAGATDRGAHALAGLLSWMASQPSRVLGLGYSGQETLVGAWPVSPGEDGFVTAPKMLQWARETGNNANVLLRQWAEEGLVLVDVSATGKRAAAGNDWIAACQTAREFIIGGRQTAILGYSFRGALFGSG